MMSIKTIIDFTLGDGYLGFATTGSKHARLKLGHSIKQRDYVQHKAMRLREYGYTVRELQTDRTYTALTNSHADFTLAHKWLYNKRIKTIDKALLRQLDAESLAYWFMDDGSISTLQANTLRNGDVIRYQTKKIKAYELYTNNFTYDEVVLIQDWLRTTFDVISHMYNKRGYYLVVGDITSKDNFRNAIESFIIPSMRYKVQYPHTFRDMPFIIEKHAVVETERSRHV